MKNVVWKLSTGEFVKTIKAPENELPIEVATKILEKFFKQNIKKKKKMNVDVITFLSHGSKDKKEYIFPTDVVFANAGLYDHAEKILIFRIKKTYGIE